MNLADLAIKRPTFIACVVILMLAVGYLSLNRLGVDLFPDVTFPVVVVTTPYPGAGPSEIETLVSKPLEDEIGTLPGVKRLSSVNQEGVSTVVTEFTLETDIKYAEQLIRDRVGSAKRKLPEDIEEPVIRRIDPSDQPVIIFSLSADLEPAALYDLANETIKPKLEQVSQVGLVDVMGGRRREIHVALDRHKLKAYELSATQVAQRLASSGENIPAGKVDESKKETVFRTLGEFTSVKDIGSTILNFLGNDRPTRVSDVGEVIDTLEDEKSQTFVNGKKSLFLMAFRQSGANTIAVVDALKKRAEKLNTELAGYPGKPSVQIVRDASLPIHSNVDDVKETIYFGVLLAVVVVFFFLGSGRSTLITGLALPNSLIGSFILMWAAGFSINMMSLLALSLTVGLLIDDAIVVRENIFRHIEMGKNPLKAASEGTAEVRLAVIATTLAVIAVFGPVAFLSGVVGQFFKQFGLTVCFAMAISLFDALTIAPMLSAYFAGSLHKKPGDGRGLWSKTVGRLLRGFDRFQTALENGYETLLRYTVRRPGRVLAVAFLVFLGSCASIAVVPKTFLPPQDNGEFLVALDMPPGTSLQAMSEIARQVDEVVRKNAEVEITALTVGNRDGEANTSTDFIRLVPSKQRQLNTTQMKDKIRGQLKDFAFALPKVKDNDVVGGGQRPFNINIIGSDQKQIEQVAAEAFERLKKNPGLTDIETTYKPGKPEIQVIPEKQKLGMLGFSVSGIGQELRAQIEGVTPAKFRQNGLEYDVRVRLREDQRNLRTGFNETFVPNLNNRLVRLPDVADAVETTGPAKINRQDRGRYIQIGADITPGYGMGEVMQQIDKMFHDDIKLPPGVRYAFVGQAENFQELTSSMAVAMGLGVLFIFLVLASLYESFVTPVTIMVALPLAMCGSFVALAITRQSMNIFSMIGMVMLLGVATKNSILLVDYANQLIRDGKDRATAMIQAGRVRLRPILMTTMALIAGTIPVALGLNEASRQRVSMGVAIIGGLISSTLLTLVVVPALFAFVDRFRVWSKNKMKRLFGVDTHAPLAEPRPETPEETAEERPTKAQDLLKDPAW